MKVQYGRTSYNYNPSDYGYSRHVREVTSINGIVLKGNKALGLKKGDSFSSIFPMLIQENRVGGHFRSVTVLDEQGKRVVTLDAYLTQY